jgi:quinol monooxygenase YgiN
MTEDTVVSLCPYFTVHEGQMDAFRDLCEAFLEKAKQEPGCLYYGWTFHGNVVHCREAYKDAAGVLAHLQNVDAELKEALAISELSRLEIHACASDIEKLREPLKDFTVEWFTWELGYRK